MAKAFQGSLTPSGEELQRRARAKSDAIRARRSEAVRAKRNVDSGLEQRVSKKHFDRLEREELERAFAEDLAREPEESVGTEFTPEDFSEDRIRRSATDDFTGEPFSETRNRLAKQPSVRIVDPRTGKIIITAGEDAAERSVEQLREARGQPARKGDIGQTIRILRQQERERREQEQGQQRAAREESVKRQFPGLTERQATLLRLKSKTSLPPAERRRIQALEQRGVRERGEAKAQTTAEEAAAVQAARQQDEGDREFALKQFRADTERLESTVPLQIATLEDATARAELEASIQADAEKIQARLIEAGMKAETAIDVAELEARTSALSSLIARQPEGSVPAEVLGSLKIAEAFGQQGKDLIEKSETITDPKSQEAIQIQDDIKAAFASQARALVAASRVDMTAGEAPSVQELGEQVDQLGLDIPGSNKAGSLDLNSDGKVDSKDQAKRDSKVRELDRLILGGEILRGTRAGQIPDTEDKAKLNKEKAELLKMKFPSA